MGSVSPLLAAADKIREREEGAVFLWIGTASGPEREIVEKKDISYKAVSWGKLRRYFDLRNILAPFGIFLGFLQSIFHIMRFRPQVIVTAGSFVSVPVAWAGRLLGVPILVHQQDVSVGLANRLMASFASKITVSYAEFLRFFPKGRAVWTGHPIREGIAAGRKEAEKFFDFKNDLPTVLFMGGGTGAKGLNDLVARSLPFLLKKCNVIHLQGRGREAKTEGIEGLPGEYRPYDYLDKDLKYAYAMADLVVSRAGMGSLTELSHLGKPTVIIPMPSSHQEENAEFFSENGAAVVLSQPELSPETLAKEVLQILENPDTLELVGNEMKRLSRPGAAEAMAKEVTVLARKQAIKKQPVKPHFYS